MWRQAYTDDGFDLTAKSLFAKKRKKQNQKRKQWGVPFSKSCLIKVTVASTTENRYCLYLKSQLKNDFHENICPEEGHFLKEGQNKIKQNETKQKNI